MAFIVNPRAAAAAAATVTRAVTVPAWTYGVKPRGGAVGSVAVTAVRTYGRLAGSAELGHVDPTMHSQTQMYSTTILSVRKDGKVAVVGDGQVTLGSMVVKPNATKVRRLGKNVIAGFAGATADAFTLFERLEAKLDEHPDQLTRACVELAKAWRTEKYLRRLEAIMLVADAKVSLTITGSGDVIEPQDGIIAIGSGGPFALAAARALIDTNLSAMEIAEKSMKIASEMCVYTNGNFVKDSLDTVA